MRLYGGTDKLVHGYAPAYERHTAHFRYRRIRILEIGAGGYDSLEIGGSLRVWRDWFPRARIVGFDIHPKKVDLGPRVGVVQGDQSNTGDLARAVEALGGAPNIVIDDGSHLADHGRISFKYLFPLMDTGGVYAIEDLHTSYWLEYGGNIPAPRSTAVGFARELIDDVQVNDETFVRRPEWGPRPAPAISDRIAEMHIYPGIFFLTKR